MADLANIEGLIMGQGAVHCEFLMTASECCDQAPASHRIAAVILAGFVSVVLVVGFVTLIAVGIIEIFAAIHISFALCAPSSCGH